MKHKSLLNLFLSVSILYATPTLAVTYNYTTLIFQDYENLKPIVRNSIKESRRYKHPKDGDRAVTPLKKTFKLILSRPDNDDLIRKLAPDLVGEMSSLGVFYDIVGELFKEAQEEVKTEGLSPKVRTTSMIMLNNLLLFLRPRILDEKQLALNVCALADKKIKIPKAIQRDTKLTTMFNSTSPSDLAKKIMLWYAKKKNKPVATNTKGCPFSKRS